MGRLLSPGLGELLDRLTILRLKIIHGQQKQGGTGAYKHFEAEEAQINMLLDRMGHPDDNDVLLLQVKLQQVNAKLWELEDEMAVFAVADTAVIDLVDSIRCSTVAVQIWRMNRERNALIHEINTLAGCATGPEKLGS